jgi:hypothetical protein
MPGAGGGDGTGSVDGGSGTTEQDIPPDVPPEVDSFLANQINVTRTSGGAGVNLYEACKKIAKGDELAATSLILARKMVEVSDSVFQAVSTVNVKSTARSVNTSRADLTATGALYQLLEFLAEAGIIQNDSTA